MIRELLAGKAPKVYGSGKAERDFLYVGDAVQATIRAALADRNIDPINIVRGQSSPIRKIVELLIDIIDCSLPINYLTDKPDGHSLRFDNSLMRKVLGDWSLVSLANGLAEEVKACRRLENVN